MTRKISLALLIPTMILLLSAHFYLGQTSIRAFSPTYDEPIHLTAGFVYWKIGRYIYNGYHHPPLAEMWAAIPLLYSHALLPVQDIYWLAQRWTAVPQYRFADKFLYHNRVSADDLMSLGRSMQLLLSLLLLLAMIGVAWHCGGPRAGLFSLVFGSLSSTLLAHGTVVSTDLAFAVFFFLFFGLFAFPSSSVRALAMGLFLGLCIASKFSAVGILPVLAAMMIWRARPKILGGPTARWNFDFMNGLTMPYTLISAAVAILTVGFIYRFSEWAVFWEGFHEFLSRAQSGRSAYFWGRHSETGWLLYFPALILIKTEIPILLSILIGVGLILRRKLVLPSWMWIPPLVFLCLSCFSKVQIGHRYILAVYPFLFIIAGSSLAALPVRWSEGTALVLGGWMMFSTFTIRPDFLSYFNETVGGSKNGYRYATDSNVDWGQGLAGLRNSLSGEDLKKGIYLCYFGVADPHYYGLKYLNVGSDQLAGHQDDSSDLTLSPTVLAISATNLQSTYYADRNLFSWLNGLKPRNEIMNSIFVYDFKNNPEALAKIKSLRGGQVQ